MTSPAENEGATVSYHRSRPRGRSALSLTIRTALLAGLTSVLIAAGLAWQMASGADPALKSTAQASSSDPKRTIVQTTVVKRVVGSGGGSSSSSSSSTPSPAPVVSSPAPVTSSTS